MKRLVLDSRIINDAAVTALCVTRQIRHYDVIIKLGGSKFLIPVIIDSENKETNYDFTNLPDWIDQVKMENEDVYSILLDKIDATIAQMPSLEDCKHLKDDAAAEQDFYKDVEGQKFFRDAIEEAHEEYSKHHPISFLNDEINAADEPDKGYSFDEYLQSRHEPYQLEYFRWMRVRQIIDELPSSVQPFYKLFYDTPVHTHTEWQQCFDRLINELKSQL